MENKKSVGIWIRVSTEDQVKGESPEHHEKRAQYYAESKDWLVKEVYRLEAVSGKSVMEHPETKRMLADVRSHKITGIIFSKLARLARNTRELLDFADIFRECDADLVSLQESIDTSTPAGRLFYTMIAAMAQWEREEIADRVAASVPIRAKLGKPLGGAAPFGYQWVDKKLLIDSKEAPVRKRVYELFLEHRRKRRVARLLNESGYRTRNGGRFSDTTVDRLLRDPVAKGRHRMNYTKSLGQKKKWVIKPEDQWIHISVEPIVSDEMWAECNQILGEQHQKQNRRPAEHLFTGIVFCNCGNKMYVPNRSPKYTCYKCHNKIPASDLEAIYQEQLKTFFFSNEEISSYLNKADELINDRQNLFTSLENEAKKLKQEMDKLVRLHLDGEMPKEGFGNHYRPMEDRLKQIQNQLPELQGEIDYLKIQYLSSDEVLSEAKDLYERWPTLELSEKRNIVETITKSITITSDEVSINLSYMPSSAEMTTGMQHNVMVALHFCEFTLTAKKQLSEAYRIRKGLEVMGKKRHTPEEIITKLREADVLQAKGQSLAEACRQIAVSAQTYYNWRKEYGRQLHEDIREAILGNVGTIISFRVGPEDAEALAKEFHPTFTQTDLMNLPNHNIYLKLMIDGVTSIPFSAATLPLPQKATSHVEEVIATSRARYGRHRKEVEAVMQAREFGQPPRQINQATLFS